MAKYTFELRELVETFGEDVIKQWFTDYNLEDYLTPAEIEVINKRGTWSKDKLAQKIIDHYYMYESGQETPALLKHYARVAMREIMEEKLPLIYSASIEYDPLVNVDYTEQYEGDNKGSTTSKGDGTNIASDTPQGKISKAQILGGDYASTASGNEYSGNGTSEESQKYKKTVRGNSGVSATAQKMIEQYRQNIIMIDRDIIDDLAKLFMGLL